MGFIQEVISNISVEFNFNNEDNNENFILLHHLNDGIFDFIFEDDEEDEWIDEAIFILFNDELLEYFIYIYDDFFNLLQIDHVAF